MATRFTIDGSPELEDRLALACERTGREVQAIVPPQELAALVLGGGYGRGEGGVLKTETGDQPYNDLDFYIFVRGRRRGQRGPGCLHDLAGRLSVEMGVEVELKIESLERWLRAPVSMFSYDLASGRRVVCGEETILENGGQHRDATAIPLSEATRLLFNRSSGLLLARELLQEPALSSHEADFVGRNLAKMQLALGDAVLAAFGKYHWSVRERHRRLCGLAPAPDLPWLEQAQREHAAGLEFKLHPSRESKSVNEFVLEHQRLAALASRAWLWLESRRLKRQFLSVSDYALSVMNKCPGMPAWRNFLVSLRTFGPGAALDGLSWQYPRARLFHALSLLLWNPEGLKEPRLLRRVQRDLHTDAPDWPALVSVFKQIWPHYG